MMLFVMAIILMILLANLHKLFLVFAVAPLALIGIVAERSAARFRGDSLRAGADGHPDPQLGDLDRADRKLGEGKETAVNTAHMIGGQSDGFGNVVGAAEEDSVCRARLERRSASSAAQADW